MKRSLFALAAAGASAMLAMPSASAAHEGAVYTATLNELNDSGASGTATLAVSQDGETMTLQIEASGLNLDGPHAQHLHGIVEGEIVQASSCPTSADDADGDGIVTVVEGAGKYGGVQVSATTSGDTSADSALAVDRYPSGTSISYSRSNIDIPDVLKPNLAKLHVVIHGIDEDGNGTLTADQAEKSSLDPSLPREATAPALCGTFTAQVAGAVQAGAGGTATSQDDTTRNALLGLGGLAAAYGALQLRRRHI